MAAILGLRGTGDWGTDERPKNFRETILWNMPNGMAPLLALMGRLSDESVDDPEFSWWEETLNLQKVQVNGALGTSDTAIVVDEGAFQFVVGDVLAVAVESAAGVTQHVAEHVRVTSNASTDTTITVSRGFAGTTAAAIADNAILVYVGSSHPEGGSAPRAANRNPTKFSNFTQIFKTTYEMTKTAAKTNLRTGDPVQLDKKRKTHDHSVSMEMAFLFGRKAEFIGDNGKPQRTMQGLLRSITTNRMIFSGQGDAANQWGFNNFIDAISPVWNFNAKEGSERLVFCGNKALTDLNKLAKIDAATQINFDGVVKTFGMNLQRWVTPHGELYFRTHPLMTQHPILNEAMVIIAPSNLKYRYLRGRDTMFEDNIQQKGDDALKGQWLTECSLETHHEYTMAYLGNCGG